MQMLYRNKQSTNMLKMQFKMLECRLMVGDGAERFALSENVCSNHETPTSSMLSIIYDCSQKMFEIELFVELVETKINLNLSILGLLYC